MPTKKDKANGTKKSGTKKPKKFKSRLEQIGNGGEMTLKERAKQKATTYKKTLPLAKLYVKNRDKRTCQHCGVKCEGSNCHASHVIPVSRDKRLSIDHVNMKVLCYHCHINRWHKHPTESGERFKVTFPDRLKYLQDKYCSQPLGTIQLEDYEYWYGFYTSPITMKKR